MTYAVVIAVKVDIDTSAAHRREALESQVVPEMMQLPGFQLASWMNDGVGSGMCHVQFDTEAHALAALGPLTTGPGPEIVSAGVYEVEYEASI